MRPRTRKLIGSVLLLAFIAFWALFAMGLAQGWVTTLTAAVQTAAFIVLGLIWTIPAALLIRWMSRPDR